MLSKSILTTALMLSTALQAPAADNTMFYRYKPGILSYTGPSDPGPVDPDPADPVTPDIANQNKTVLGTSGTAIGGWVPVAAPGWTAAVVDADTRAAWSIGGLAFSASHDLSQYGLSFNSQTGRITGTPSQAFVISDFQITVSAGDESDTTTPFWLGVSPSNPISFVNGQTDSYTVRAGTTHTTNPIQVSNAVGALSFSNPAGIPPYAWDAATGALTWMRSDPGFESFSTTVTDEFNRNGTFAFDVTYLPALTVNTLAPVELIGTWNYALGSVNRKPTAEGILGAATWDDFDGPAGIDYNVDTGDISGTVTSSSQQGTHDITVLVIDDTDGSNATGSLTVNVLPPFTGQSFGTTTMKQGATMIPAVLEVKDRTPQANPYTGGGLTWSRVSGSLPPGINTSGSGSQFTFSGAASSQGTFTSVWQARDSAGWRYTFDPVTFVVEPRDPLSINLASSIPAVGRQTYTAAAPLAQPTANNIVGSASWSAVGLPTGLTIDPVTGAITGTITNGALYQGTTAGIQITVTDSADNQDISASFDLTTTAPFSALAYTPPTLKVGTAMTVGGPSLRGAGAVPYTGYSVTYQTTSGALPAGISANVVNDQLQFSGTPTTQGSANVVFRLTDAQGWNITLPRLFWTIQP